MHENGWEIEIADAQKGKLAVVGIAAMIPSAGLTGGPLIRRVGSEDEYRYEDHQGLSSFFLGNKRSEVRKEYAYAYRIAFIIPRGVPTGADTPSSSSYTFVLGPAQSIFTEGLTEPH